MADRICIDGLRINAIIGFHEWEREREQELVLDLVLHTDTRKAAETDDVQHTVDYAKVRDAVMDKVTELHAGLLETVAERVANLILRDFQVDAVDVRVRKPHALRFAKEVAVEIHRP